jgi:hypothetical protein
MIINPQSLTHDVKTKDATLRFPCVFCNERIEITLTQTEFNNRYIKLMSIQTAMPNRSATEREILTSGMCEKCQKLVFGD